MTSGSRVLRLLIVGSFLASSLLVAQTSGQTPPEPGATPGVMLNNISQNGPSFASVFPQVAVSRNSNLVTVAWRRYGLPIDIHTLKEDRVAECHISISTDGGESFSERNMMDVLRTPCW